MAARPPTCTVAAQESGSVSGVPVSGVVVGVGVGAADFVGVGVGDGAAERVGVGVAGAGAGDCVPVMATPVSRSSSTRGASVFPAKAIANTSVAVVICKGLPAGDPVTASLCLY